jgi:hypothetical protein
MTLLVTSRSKRTPTILVAAPFPVLNRAEAELERLRGIVRNQEHALRVAGKVLSPYLNRL